MKQICANARTIEIKTYIAKIRNPATRIARGAKNRRARIEVLYLYNKGI